MKGKTTAVKSETKPVVVARPKSSNAKGAEVPGRAAATKTATTASHVEKEAKMVTAPKEKCVRAINPILQTPTAACTDALLTLRPSTAATLDSFSTRKRKFDADNTIDDDCDPDVDAEDSPEPVGPMYHHNVVLPLLVNALLSHIFRPELVGIMTGYASVVEEIAVYVLAVQPFDDERNQDGLYSHFFILPTRRACYIKGILLMVDDIWTDEEDGPGILRKMVRLHGDPISSIIRNPLESWISDQKQFNAQHPNETYPWKHARATMESIGMQLSSDNHVSPECLERWFDKLNEAIKKRDMLSTRYEIMLKTTYDNIC